MIVYNIGDTIRYTTSYWGGEGLPFRKVISEGTIHSKCTFSSGVTYYFLNVKNGLKTPVHEERIIGLAFTNYDPDQEKEDDCI